ncbi:hypothetical protein BJV77DRAFT_390513 [Russula vinacea]|nr:hypothetical protein BJV77DRAFT_390513 [Russula vinacea]
MMKFDIAKNEEGPLRRTLKVEVKNENNRPTDKTIEGEHPVTANRYPGLDERLKNLETHLAMRYVPSPPASLLHRIKFVEDHIIQLEREYPPWAALHFNQPRRVGLHHHARRQSSSLHTSHLTLLPTRHPHHLVQLKTQYRPYLPPIQGKPSLKLKPRAVHRGQVCTVRC